MFKSVVFAIGEVTFAQIDAALSKLAESGYGIVSGPVYLPVQGSAGAFVYTMADLREPATEELPKPTILPRADDNETIAKEAQEVFDARRTQGE